MERRGLVRDHLIIWGSAFGYFACYIPYSALTRALSQGLLPGMDRRVAGLLILPATAMATSALLLIFLAAIGAWYASRRGYLEGRRLFAVRPETVCSGVATAVIIATTTLNYTFHGVSILLALLLMRGGVLILGPVVDRLFGRKVDLYAWQALACCLVAIVVALSEVGGYTLTVAAVANIAGYLAGYAIRLSIMTSLAKSDDPEINLRYFVQETLVAAFALTSIPALLAVFAPGEAGDLLRAGFTTFLAGDLARPAALIGVFYACLYLFGTCIYLDRREHTFCIPLNRCSSLMSGVVASYALSLRFGWPPPSAYQLAGAGIILLALLSLMVSAIRDYRSRGRVILQRIYLFVCGGNTSRSPMAQAICNDEIARRLGLSPGLVGSGSIRAVSAGLTATSGRPFTEASIATLRALDITPHDHAARPVTAELVAQAELVFCMTEAQRLEFVERFPEASAKVQRLDPDGDVEDPSGRGDEAYRAMADRFQSLIRSRIPVFTS